MEQLAEKLKEIRANRRVKPEKVTRTPKAKTKVADDEYNPLADI